ncbi:MAG: NADP-dependent malic enzyme [Candidatus Methanoplasma sp.]|jgi:malate dehydrogenase (oxaloacetate-decarboxylating)|nr:NADP-dependent malic enzyme [Candidatus Methanoplasma sp.]
MVSDKDISVEERLAKAKKPGQDAMVLHRYYGGKIEIVPKACVRSFDDFAIWYSPGVAEPCKDIAKNPEMVYEHTCKWNTVAVVSDGTRVLGLGDIGPEAAMPVMEGKSMLFKYLGGVDSVPICLDTKDPEKIIETVRLIAPSFGGINLEDISNPKCFDVLDELRRDCKIPVWHDDQQGTATVEVAGAINAMKLVGKKLSDANITVIGAGAASIAIARLLLATGFSPKHLCMCDSKGILNMSRKDVEGDFRQKWEICQKTDGAGKSGGMKEAMEGADIVIAASKPGPGTIPPEYCDLMADDAVVFATANPIPEIWPWEAKEHGVRIFATGRSDFPNQVNNSMGFPAIFRGVLDVRAKTITDEMCIAAATELAKCAEEKGISEDYIIPTMSETEVFPREAVAVAMKAQEQGVARLKLSRSELFDRADYMIRRSRGLTAKMMDDGYIADASKAFLD